MVEEDSGMSNRALASVEAGALVNAIRHGGKAEVGAVIGRVLAEFPELRHKADEVASAVRSTVAQINKMSLQEQEVMMAQKYPDAERPAQKVGRVGLPPLPNAVKGKTSFRLPPEPSGFMTVGHAMAFTINSIYAETYDGELWLRFEDTNPRKVAKRYYESFRHGIKWLGIRLDHEKNVSDDLDLIYDYGKRLIQEDKAYSCSCSEEKVKRLRFEGQACSHRTAPVERSLTDWDLMLAKKVGEGEAFIRLKGDMQNLDYSLRDPNLFRVIQKPHPMTGDRYTLWPTYYLANTIEDEICGITHILRSSEFSTELQRLIREALGFRTLDVIQFSRFNFKGTPVHKRLLRPLVEGKLVTGWDDPRMPTVDGLMRRGVIPETIREFTLQVGYTKSEHEYDWSMLLSLNRKLLDPHSKRIFFVPDPVELKVEGAPKRSVTIPYHPEVDLGEREIATSGRFFVSKSDLAILKKGNVFRLMELYDVELTSDRGEPRARYAGEEVVREMRKVQWVTPGGIDIEVLEPGLLFDEQGNFNKESLGVAKGLAEVAFSSLKLGEVVQFPRFGFCRVDAERTCIMA